MAHSFDILDVLNADQWEMKEDCDNKDDYKDFRIGRHVKNGDAHLYVAQLDGDEEGEIYHLSINSGKTFKKDQHPFQGAQLIKLAIKDRKDIVGIASTDSKYFVRK